MSELPEDIDHFFKQHIDEVDVKYNPAHWDKLRKALPVQSDVVGDAANAGKALLFKKVFFAVVAFVAIVVVGYYLFYELQPNEQVHPPITADSIPGGRIIEGTNESEQFQMPLDNQTNVPASEAQTDMDKKAKQELKNENGTTLPVFEKDNSLGLQKQRNDSTSVITKDTLSKRKKIGVFW